MMFLFHKNYLFLTRPIWAYTPQIVSVSIKEQKMDGQTEEPMDRLSEQSEYKCEDGFKYTFTIQLQADMLKKSD